VNLQYARFCCFCKFIYFLNVFRHRRALTLRIDQRSASFGILKIRNSLRQNLRELRILNAAFLIWPLLVNIFPGQRKIVFQTVGKKDLV